MADLPKVSVVVPVFNAGSKLVPSIESLLNQTLKDIEIIIVNDASTDDSGSIIDQLAKENANIVVVQFSENKGVHEARLAGLKKSAAPWIGFLDADDFARPNMFQTLLSAAVDNDVDIAVCGSYRVTEQRKVIAPKLRFRRSERVDENVLERFCAFEFGTGMLWNKLFRRSVIEPWFELHFPWRQSTNEDVLLNAACFYRAKSVFLMKDMLHEYMESEESVTAKIDKVKAFVEIYSAFALAVDFFKGCDNKTLISIVDLYRNQFLRWDLQIYDLATLSDLQPKIVEATELAYKASPLSLGLLVARSSRVDFLVKVKMYLKRFVKKLLQGPLYKGR